MTAASVVLDASVLVRSAVTGDAAARTWVRGVERGDVEGHVPELAYAECVSAVAQYVRAGLLDIEAASDTLRALTELPLVAHSHARLARPSLTLAFELGLSAYDAAYAALAEILAAPLITADRRLAAAIPGGELLS